MASVTPQRRARSDSLESDNGSKRARTDAVLPDSFRRSPEARSQNKHQKGSIVRVKLADFVTYSSAEFHPGPNLNMVIGPNGTGKSTLVCAICIGLGFKPDHLGRAKQLTEFVKNGTKKAEIEIELASEPENVVVTCRIARSENKATYLIDGRQATRKQLEKLMRSFSIQIDNLCQFLPQDKVVDFAALSPANLLIETQRAAAAPEMAQWHDKLKKLHKDRKAKDAERQRTAETVASHEKRQNEQEADVTRYREHAEAQKRIAALEKLRPFTEYTIAKARHAECKEKERKAKETLERLKRDIEPNFREEQKQRAYVEKVNTAVESKARLVTRAETTAGSHMVQHNEKQATIESLVADLDAEKKSIKEITKDLPRLQQELRKTKNAMENPPPPVDFASYNEQLREKVTEIREITSKMDEIKQESDGLKQQVQHQHQNLQRIEQEREHSQTQAGQLANKLRTHSRDAAVGWDWIQKNRDKFQSPVFGPPIVECQPKDPKNAAAIEAMVQLSELSAFTATSEADFNMLSNTLFKQLKLSNINVRSVRRGLEDFRPPCSRETLHGLGLEAFVLDLIEGPEPVLAMLCDNRNIHATGFTSKPLSTQHLDALKAQNSPISSWVTATDSWQVIRRREYNASSTRSNALRPARIFTNVSGSHTEDAELERRTNDANRALRTAQDRLQALNDEYKELGGRKKQLSTEQEEIREEKNRLQKQQSDFAGLEPKLHRAEQKLTDARERVRSFVERKNAMTHKIDKLYLEKGQKVIDYANAVESMRSLYVQMIEQMVASVEAKSDLARLKERNEDERRQYQTLQVELRTLNDATRQALAHGKQLSQQCRAIAAEMQQDEYLHKVYDDMPEWTPEQLQTEIESVQARIEMNHGHGGARALKEYEERAKRIEAGKAKLNDMDKELTETDEEITSIRGRWEPKLDQLVGHISEAFSENFSKIQCAGEVGIHKDEDFEHWAIQIKVKFRDNEPLSILDSHRQSGGERAVSTIFYLMALQSMARAPFRVVDEINQGMDPRNERLVHSRMVDIACSEESASQYFLITPKLLSGLKYHPNMKVHCIASGEYMPEDHEKLNFENLARRALALRG